MSFEQLSSSVSFITLTVHKHARGVEEMLSHSTESSHCFQLLGKTDLILTQLLREQLQNKASVESHHKRTATA